ncbi:MAG TPA: hypothetical protein VN282_07100 [Pyrinomonadaceae bacterium]|nr:hypothetical protein [Pyrinomonadaceae bacterium]
MLERIGGALPFNPAGVLGAAEEMAEAGLNAASALLRESAPAALGLAEGYASRVGLLACPTFAAQPAARASRGGRQFDGLFVGAGGATYSPSTPLGSVRPVLPRGGARVDETLVYVNGINTTKDGQLNSLQRIADQTGARVVGIHNATRGATLDIIQSISDTLDIGRNPAVDTLASTVYEEIRAGRTVHLMAHSQGGLITSRALTDVRNRLMLEDGLSAREAEALLSRVRVETFGGAAAYYPNGPQYVHYVNRLDPVPGLFGLGPLASPLVHPGRGAVVHRFTSAHDVHDFNDTYLSRRVPFEQARRRDFD